MVHSAAYPTYRTGCPQAVGQHPNPSPQSAAALSTAAVPGHPIPSRGDPRSSSAAVSCRLAIGVSASTEGQHAPLPDISRAMYRIDSISSSKPSMMVVAGKVHDGGAGRPHGHHWIDQVQSFNGSQFCCPSYCPVLFLSILLGKRGYSTPTILLSGPRSISALRFVRQLLRSRTVATNTSGITNMSNIRCRFWHGVLFINLTWPDWR